MYFGVTSSDAEDLWDYAIQKLNTYPLAYLLLTEPRVGALSVLPLDDPSIHQPLRNARFRTLTEAFSLELAALHQVRHWKLSVQTHMT